MMVCVEGIAVAFIAMATQVTNTPDRTIQQKLPQNYYNRKLK